MAPNSAGIPAGRLAQYAMLVASVPGLERRGSKAPFTSLNGNKSSFLTDTGSLALRLDSDGRYAFMREHQAKLCERHGRVMKEYVAVPEQLWKQRNELRRAFVSSVAYVGSLKPKVSKRKKPVVAKVAAPLEAAVDEPAVVTSRTTVTRKPTKKASAPKAATKRAPAKRAPAKKTVAKKAAAKPVTKAAPKTKRSSSTAKASASTKTTTRKSTAKSTTRKTVARKAAPKKAAAKKTTTRSKAVAR